MRGWNVWRLIVGRYNRRKGGREDGRNSGGVRGDWWVLRKGRGRGRGKYTRIIHTVQPVSGQWILQSSKYKNKYKFDN